jgi:predicted NAD/FAD-dependent oxidoreductase
MSTSKDQTDCLIIGSGICGLMAARSLIESGFSVLILDKGRGSGGRLATRRVSQEQGPEGRLDYGAPLFSVRTPLLQSLALEWERAGIIIEWNNHTQNEISKNYIGLQGMRGIAKYLALKLDINQSEKVIHIEQKNSWTLKTEKGNRYQASSLMITAPLPQALILLDENQIKLEQTARKQLDQIEYDPCIAMFGILESPSKLDAPGAFSMKDGPINWIADHQKRGISPVPTYTAHMSPSFSLESWDLPEEQLISMVSPEIMRLLGSNLKTHRIHRWKYANAQNTFSQQFYSQKLPLPLILAGDGFLSGGVEGALLSGIAAAEAITEAYSD